MLKKIKRYSKSEFFHLRSEMYINMHGGTYAVESLLMCFAYNHCTSNSRAALVLMLYVI